MSNNRDGTGRFRPGASGNQAGRPRKQADPFAGPEFEAAVDRAVASRVDGWANVITGFGQAARDKRMSTTFCADEIGDDVAAELWRGSDLGAKAVEVWPNEMLREGWDITMGADGDKERAENVVQMCEDLEIDPALNETLCYQRAYGGGAIMMGIQDGRLPSEPVNLPTVRSVDWLTTLEPREIQPKWWYSNPQAPNFGKVETWQVTPMSQGVGKDYTAGATLEIHESRLLVFNGTRVSRLQHNHRAFWGDSVFTRIFSVLRDFSSAFDSIGVQLHELGIPIWEVDNLAQIVTSKDSSLLANRVKAMDFCKSVIRAIVIAKGEVYRRDTMNFSGVPELLDRFAEKLAAAMDMPITLMLGRSPAGMNATGESDMRGWYDRVAAMQRKRLRPVLMRFLRLLWGKSEPKQWSVKFRKLWQPTEKEQAETRKIVVDMMIAQVDAQIITPEEARQSMHGGDEFSMEVQLDESLTAPEDFQEPPAPVSPGAPPGDEPPPEGDDGGAPPNGEPPAPKKPKPRTDWDPDQPRDENGRWGDGGAVGSGPRRTSTARRGEDG